LLEQCCRQIGWRRHVGLRLTDAIPSPAVCGFHKPTVLIPVRLLKKLSPERLRSALIHEIAHIKRGDLWVNGLQTLVQVVYFYNPFVWFANAMIRRVCEETVLVTLGGDAEDYSDTLLDISETVFRRTALGLRLIGVAESRRTLKRRIKHMLTRPVPKSAKIGAFGTVAILLIAAILLPMARAERSNLEASSTGQETSGRADEMVPTADQSDVIVDPDTGVKFVLDKTFSGANNRIAHVNKLIMSPDARFLVFWGRVIPLDGTETFSYAEPERWGDVRDVAVSPNGRYIAHGKNAVWLQPVSPETLRPDSPAKKLLDLGEERLAGWYKPLRWTRDSQVVFFKTNDAEGRSHRYAFSAATGDPVSYPDAAATGLPSPDGKRIALTDTPGFWVKPIGDRAARVLCERGSAPECWSIDGKWLIGFQPPAPLVDARFVSYPEGQEYHISMPKELAKDNNTTCLGVSPDRETLYFYQAGYKLTYGVWVASAEGTALNNVDVGWGAFQWAQDGKAVLHNKLKYTATQRKWKRHLFLSTLSGEKPTQFTLSPAVSADKPFSVSPDSKWLLFSAAKESGRSTVDLSVIPLSITDHKASGPATVVFRITPPAQGSSRASVSAAWSPDSTRVALTCKADSVNEQDIWVAFTDGRTPIRLTRTAATERNLKWSLDGNMLAYISDDAGTAELKVIPTAGGEAVVLRQWAGSEAPLWGWSPDSKSLTIVEEGMLVRQPWSGGKAEPFANLEEYGIEDLMWLGWSPDGRRLALAHYTRNNKGLLASYGQLLFARVEEGRLQKTGATELGAATTTKRFAWSPDSTHVACEYEGLVATSPGGRLYAAAVDDIVERIEAGAIPATQPKSAESTTGNTR